jgi:taurine dioxygenase
MPIEAQPLTGVFAAEVHGIDLVNLDGDDLAVLRALMCEHEVLVVRGQNLNPSQQSAFSSRLGPFGEVPFIATMDEFPEVIRVVKEADEGAAFNFGGAWHSDFSFQAEPPSFTILSAVEVPTWGGDTCFASMTAAWNGLHAPMQDRLRELNAVHSARDAYSPKMQALHTGMSGMQIVCDESANESQVHPLVPRHAETHKEVLYFNRAYVRDIENMPHDEAQSLMSFLHLHTTDVKFMYRHRWQAGDVVIWDNRSTQHVALNDYAGFRRELRRTTIAGESPKR